MSLRFLVAFAVGCIHFGCGQIQAADRNLVDDRILVGNVAEDPSARLDFRSTCSVTTSESAKYSSYHSDRIPSSDSSTPRSCATTQVYATHLNHSVRMSSFVKDVEKVDDLVPYLYAAYATNIPQLGERLTRSERDCFVIAVRIGFVMRTSLNGLSRGHIS